MHMNSKFFSIKSNYPELIDAYIATLKNMGYAHTGEKSEYRSMLKVYNYPLSYNNSVSQWLPEDIATLDDKTVYNLDTQWKEAIEAAIPSKEEEKISHLCGYEVEVQYMDSKLVRVGCSYFTEDAAKMLYETIAKKGKNEGKIILNGGSYNITLDELKQVLQLFK